MNIKFPTPLVPFPAQPMAMTGLVVDRFWPVKADSQPEFTPIVTTGRGAAYKQFLGKWNVHKANGRSLEPFCQPALIQQRQLQELIESGAPNEMLLYGEQKLHRTIVGLVDTLKSCAETNPKSFNFFASAVSPVMGFSWGGETSTAQVAAILKERIDIPSESTAEAGFWLSLFFTYRFFLKQRAIDWRALHEPDVRRRFRDDLPEIKLPISKTALKNAMREANGMWVSVLDPITYKENAGIYSCNRREVLLDISRLMDFHDYPRTHRLLYHIHNHEMLHAMAGKGAYLTDPTTPDTEVLTIFSDDPYSRCFSSMFFACGVSLGDGYLSHYRNGLELFAPKVPSDTRSNIASINTWLNESVTEYLAGKLLCLYDGIEPTEENVMNRDILAYRIYIIIMLKMVKYLQAKADSMRIDIDVINLIYKAYFENTPSKDSKRNHKKLRILIELTNRCFEVDFLLKIDHLMREKRYNDAVAYIESF